MILNNRTVVTLVIENKDLLSAISFLIKGSTDFKLASVYTDMSKGQHEIIKNQSDILVVDIDALNSFDQLSYFQEKNLKSKILLISDITDHDVIIQILSFGISGYILKSSCMNEIIWALHSIKNNGAALSPVIAHRILDTFRKSQLSPLSHRESQVLKLMTLGCTYTLIASKLMISKETAKVHIRNIYGKLKVNSRAAVIQKALEDKLV